MPDDENGKSHCKIKNHSKPKDVYKMLRKLNVPETTSWRVNLKLPSTTEMVKDTEDSINGFFKTFKNIKPNWIN